MPVFRIEVFKGIGAEKWENRYHALADDIATAAAFAQDVAFEEQKFHSVQVVFDYARISTELEGDNVFINVPLGYIGNQPAGNTGDLWPLWNCYRLNFSQPTGRPSFKLYRGVLGDSNTLGGNVTTTLLLTTVPSAMAGLLIPTDGAALTDENGTPFLGVQAQLGVAKRDLRRRKRRVTPPSP